MSTSDAGRAQPAYGEYATPEQVARARGMSLEEYERHLATLAAPRTTETTPDAASAPPATSNEGVPKAVAPASGRANRFATMALLAFGLTAVLLSIPGFLQFDVGLRGAFEAQGLEAYTSVDVARTMGIAIVVGQLLLWVLTLAVTLAALRRGRLSWWIPLVGGAVAVLLVSVLAIAAIVVDPAFSAYMDGISAGQ